MLRVEKELPMTTFSSPELVSAVMAERRREARDRSLVRAARIACERCAQAAGGLFGRLFIRRGASAC